MCCDLRDRWDLGARMGLWGLGGLALGMVFFMFFFVCIVMICSA